MYTYKGYRYAWRNPLALFFPLLPFLFPFHLLGTLLAVIGSCPLWSQVADKLSPQWVSQVNGEGVKGTVPPDFSPLFFFFKQLLLAPVGKPSDDFDFFQIFAEIFNFSGASPVSVTPVKQTILL